MEACEIDSYPSHILSNEIPFDGDCNLLEPSDLSRWVLTA